MATAAAAGSPWTCWQSHAWSAPSPTRALRRRLCLTFAKINRKGKKCPDTHHFSQCRLARRKKKHLPLLLRTSAAGLLQAICVCLCASV